MYNCNCKYRDVCEFFSKDVVDGANLVATSGIDCLSTLLLKEVETMQKASFPASPVRGAPHSVDRFPQANDSGDRRSQITALQVGCFFFFHVTKCKDT